jgi:large subunit ribosomal protein L6
MKNDLIKEIEITEGVTATQVENAMILKGPMGEVVREIKDPAVKIIIEGKKIILKSTKATKREKKRLHTFAAHINNMLTGVIKKHAYELKICSAHFPMNASVSGNQFVIKNFLGENAPRVLQIHDGAKIKVEGDIIHVESIDKEVAGMTASQIELLTKVKGRDRRIFQDGIFIIKKDGKLIQ